MKCSRHIFLLFIGVFLYAASGFAQPGFRVDIAKPKPYQDRKLKAEKTGEGKLKTPKLILQNLTTHYNYVFNATNKLNEILDRAKERHKDDYSQLLSFYNYSLNTTIADSTQLDSVIYKARTGILNHDLRNEWGDELYLLWAAAWHLEKKFDSAGLMLQFINYAYAPQYEDGYYKYIGTHNEGDKELSIATKEEKHFLHNNNVSRNTAFIWQVRNLIEKGNFTAAGSLITTLRRDPNFPARLANPLDEVEAYWHYSQQHWDSAAVHLLAALDGDYPKLEKARWRYLAAQLLERAGKTAEALQLYEKVAAQTPDPVMEIYARLNLVRLDKAGGEGAIDRNVAELLKMAKKDKYEDYRDIIYYMAAQMELERNNIAAASELLMKGARYDNGNGASRNRAFLQIADALYEQKKYLPAAAFYDSVQVVNFTEAETSRTYGRKAALVNVVINSNIVGRQDSLQRIAALPQSERDALIKAMVKKLRKEQGLKEEAAATPGSSFPGLGPGNPPVDLFSSQQKGEWYFYNAAAKAQGSAQFKTNWGTRPNVDNWRRFAAANRQALSSPDKVTDVVDPNRPKKGEAADNAISFENLASRLPSTPEALNASNDSIRNALFNLGVAYLENVEDIPAAINTFEELRRRFPEGGRTAETLYHLYYAYTKSGDGAAAAQMKKLLQERYPTSRYTAIVNTGKDPMAVNQNSPEATRAYEDVYNLFVEGKFAEAETAKRIADSTYKTTFWQPQLLYIESVYYIRQREDSVARGLLHTIVNQNTHKALTEKAKTLLNVLARRKEIEDELTRLQITRPSEDDTVASQPLALQPPAERKDSVVKKPVVQPPKDTAVVRKPAPNAAKDSIAFARLREKQIRDSLSLSRMLTKRKADSLALVKRDSLAQAKAAREQARQDSIALRKAMLKQATDSAALTKYFAKRRLDSLARVTRDSLALVKKQAAQAHSDSLARRALLAQQKKDSLALAKSLREQARRDSIALRQEMLKRQRDSAALAKPKARPKEPTIVSKPPENTVSPQGYVYSPGDAHYAVVVLNKVDPIFVNEAKNAFFRYNKEKYYNQPMDVQILNLSADVRLLLISGLPSAAAAADYATRAKALAPSEIIPWLTGNKYTFSVISASNLEILKVKNDMAEYQRFLEQHLPVKF